MGLGWGGGGWFCSGGVEGTRAMNWAAEALKPWPCLKKNTFSLGE